MDVWVLEINHDFGNDIHVCATRELAYKILHGFVTDWWNTEMLGQDFPSSMEEAVEAYFEEQSNESYAITPTTLVTEVAE